MEHPPSWHNVPIETIYSRLASSPAGLTEAEASRRLAEFGPNELEATRRISPWALLLAQFKNVLLIILLVATALSAFLGHGVEAIAISVIVLFSVVLGFIQEYRAERALEALRELAAPVATVLRDGEEIRLPARDLVPGDIVILQVGDKVPADLRLIEAVNLQIAEAVLTGESVPVEKHSAPLPEAELPLGNRNNMAYAGTVVTYGRGRGIVVATGMKTEFGKIAEMLQTVETERTPLQENLDRMGHVLVRAALVVVALIVVLGLLRGQAFIDMFIFGIALAVAVVPEALPAVVTISLAIGVQRMVRRNALIRRLPAVETLGCTNVICTDKTGTLTRGEMVVRQVYVAGRTLNVTGEGYEPRGQFLQNGRPVEPSSSLHLVLQAAALASDATIARRNGAWEVKGDPTEGALVTAAAKAGLLKGDLEAQYPRVHEIPFTSETKRMTTVHDGPDGPVAYTKGAPEVILEACTQVVSPDGAVPLDAAGRRQILAIAQQMAGQALRVLAVAYKPGVTLQDAEEGMTFLGLIGMIDPSRPEAKEAVEECKQAGIEVVMITGDHAITAQAIARELGLLNGGKTVSGTDLDAMSDDELERQVQDIAVYARVAPAHKLRVVTAWQKKGYVVAMTGDGVNDAPALKKADIGVAMGITGTEVTKEAGEMTLLDDNFASIVAAVEEGRIIFNNIKKYLMYLLSSNAGEILLMGMATLLGLPLPLTAVQILYVNLATDGLPALALSVDPPDADLMRRKPRNPRRGIFTRPVNTLILAGGIWSAMVNLSIFTWALNAGLAAAEAMTMTFVCLVLIEFFKAYSFRSYRHSAFYRPFANKWLNLAVLWEGFLLLLIVYLPFLQEPFSTFSLPLRDWLILVLAASSIVPVLELVKLLIRRGWFGELD